MSARKSWGDYYEGAGSAEYLLEHISIHKEFIAEILKRSPARALEAGCGSAIMSIFLSMTGIRVTACDRDPAVLGQARRTTDRWKAKTEFAAADILSLPYPADHFDVVFSQGVLEHLDDAQVRAAAQEALRVAPVFIFSVPGRHYNHKDFGDERLLDAADWRRILAPCGRLDVRPYFHLRVKRNWLRRRPLMLMGILSRA